VVAGAVRLAGLGIRPVVADDWPTYQQGVQAMAFPPRRGEADEPGSIAGHDCGLHDVRRTGPSEMFGGKVTIHAGTARPSHLAVPIVPPRKTSKVMS
jgi:hypothetical protein